MKTAPAVCVAGAMCALIFWLRAQGIGPKWGVLAQWLVPIGGGLLAFVILRYFDEDD